MILFVIYAVVVCFGAMRFRRQWPGFVIPPVGAMLLYILVPVLQSLNLGDLGIQLLLAAEAALILIVGLFIALLPRRPRYPHCPYCHYDLRGHGLAGKTAEQRSTTLCPECGNPVDGYASVRKRRAEFFASVDSIAPLNGRELAGQLRAERASSVGADSATIGPLGPPARRGDIVDDRTK